MEIPVVDPTVRLHVPNDPHLRSMGYDYHQQILEIELHSGEVYQYTGVSMFVPLALIKAPNRQRFIHGYLKRDHFSRRVPPGMELFRSPA